LTLASEYRSRVKKHHRVSCRLASPRLCVYASTMNVLHNMASNAARHRLASPRLASPRLTIFDSVALFCTRVRRAVSPRLASPCVCVNAPLAI